MYKRIAIILLHILWSLTVFSQVDSVLNGIVRDSIGKPIEGVSVTLLKKNNGAGISFAKTDKNGKFSFTIKKIYRQEDLAVKLNYVGMKILQKDYSTLNHDDAFIMLPLMHLLPEVRVKSRRNFVQKSDTVQFSVDMFRDSSDRILADLLKKIPGIKVGEDGTISYNGKSINKLYIEGDDLLDGRYNIASKNIPSKDVDKIDVIEHNQHVKMLNGIVSSDQPGLNIRLKDASKLKWVNNAEVAVGSHSKYSGKINAMAFKPKIKAINTLAANNMGQDVNSEIQDYSSAPVGANSMLSLNGSRPGGIESSRYLFNKDQLFNMNDMFKLRSESNIRINAYYAHSEHPFESSSASKYFFPGSDTIDILEHRKTFEKANHIAGTISIITNTDKKYFTENISTDISLNNNADGTIYNGQLIRQDLRSTLNGFGHEIRGIWKVKNKYIFNYQSSVGYTRSPQRLAVLPGWQSEILNNGQNYLQSLQQVNMPSWNMANNINSIIILKEWKLSNAISLNYSHKKLHSDISLQQNDNTWTEPSGFSNNVKWKELNVQYTPNVLWDYFRNRISISVPMMYQWVKYNDHSTLASDSMNRVIFNPSLDYRLLIGKENELSAGYQYNNNASVINDVYSAGIMMNYRNIISAGLPLIQGNSQKYNLRFAYKKILKLLFWNIESSYSRQSLLYIVSSTINQNIYQSIAVPLHNTRQNLSLSGDISKYVFSLHTTINASSSMSKSSGQQLQNDALFKVDNWSNSYSLELMPKLQDWIRVSASIRYSVGTSSSDAEGYQKQRTSQFTESSSVSFLWGKYLTAQVRSSYFSTYLNGNNLADCLFLDAYVNYRLRKPQLEFRLTCNNITNKREYKIVSASANLISNQTFALQPNITSLSCLFNF